MAAEKALKLSVQFCKYSAPGTGPRFFSVRIGPSPGDVYLTQRMLAETAENTEEVVIASSACQ